MSRGIDHFDQLYRRDGDPWQVHTRWYEQRKQSLLLASLPHRHHRRAFETACGTGALTAALAPRCDELLASDASEAAVHIAQAHVASAPNARHVRIQHQTLPREWPAGRFDLVVVAEWAYYLAEPDLAALARACHASLTPTGCLVACHWRHDAPDRRQSTQAVHARLGDAPGWSRLVHHEEDDFLLNVWSPSDAPGAQGAQTLATP